jgi:hypothetical protein
LLVFVLDSPIPLIFEDENAVNFDVLGAVVERAPNAPTNSSPWPCTDSPTKLFDALHDLAYAEMCEIAR